MRKVLKNIIIFRRKGNYWRICWKLYWMSNIMRNLSKLKWNSLNLPWCIINSNMIKYLRCILYPIRIKSTKWNFRISIFVQIKRKNFFMNQIIFFQAWNKWKTISVLAILSSKTKPSLSLKSMNYESIK